MTSKIKVDNIENQCGGAVVTKCGGTTTIAGTNVNATTVTATNVVGSTAVKSNNIQASDGGNLVSQSGTTITLGASGDTINLASGASQSGFGRTGTVDWQTSIKTSTITVVSGEGYFVNTTGGAITANLPAGVVGAIASFKDYANTFDSNALTVSSNGSEKINGSDVDLIVNTEGESLTLVYADATKGWLIVNDGNNDAGSQNLFVTATGGTITTCGNFKTHVFTGPGTFTVSCAGNSGGSNKVSYLVIAGGGGGGGSNVGGGGGAGGFREGKTPSTPYTASPIVAADGITVPAQAYPIAVGSGGATNDCGNNSIFSSITSAGGGGGRGSGSPGLNGGSGGGGGENSGGGGNGNTPSVSPPQGRNGGPTNTTRGGGGGAAVDTGQAGQSGGNGGAGTTTSITGSSIARGGGGGGGAYSVTQPSGGSGGTGGGGAGAPNQATAGVAGTVNTGGGGGGTGYTSGAGSAGNGGSGIVVIKYKFQ